MKFFNPKPSEMDDVLRALEHDSGHLFKNRELLLEALHHSSYASEQTPPLQSNERLEFLGDAVLELIVSREIYEKCPMEQEGRLTQIRSLLVDENANSANCIALKLDRALFLGKGEELIGGRTRKSLLGDAYEAFLGAVYLDGGYEEAEKVVHRMWEMTNASMPLSPMAFNPKGALQENCQALEGHFRPQYVMVESRGPVHAPVFEYDVVIDGMVCGHGTGASKKMAENNAAADALAHWDDVKAHLQQPGAEE